MSEKIDFNGKIDMNKKGNQISAEEAVDAFMSGKGSLSQMKEDEDGTKHFFNVYGPVADGLDHFLNVFADHDSLTTLFSAILNGKLQDPTPEQKDDSYDGFQITLDLTDKPIMWVMNGTKKHIHIAAYQRDEKKGFYDPALEGDLEVEDGRLSLNSEMIQEQPSLYYYNNN